MRRRRTCHQLRSAAAARRTSPLRAWWTRACSNTLSSTDFTRRWCREAAGTTRPRPHRQAGCMAKTEKRHKPQRLPKQIDAAVRAADDKQAKELVVLDLRKATGFTDYFVICSGTNSRQVRAIADAVIESLAETGVKPAH